MEQNLNLEVSAVSYMDFNNPDGQTTIQGIRGVSNSENVYITASLLGENNIVQGLIYEGKLIGNGNNGKWHVVNFPSTASEIVTNTSCYGPNNGPDRSIQIVGAYKITTATGDYQVGILDFIMKDLWMDQELGLEFRQTMEILTMSLSTVLWGELQLEIMM
ncbi:hypothetical protein [Flavobacterium sp. 140616W15]|uniref:hypothetical protein n=1 Tax=Flavobacterium sp. 140616W15 TaxID=2478552 RepID=UPI001F5C8700|nr:hypothetical protein [Flavobacterium sp. 140616W15]